MYLLDLPSEMHLEISSWLPEASKVCLSYTCRYFRALLDFPPPPPKSAIAEFNLGREAKDPDRQRRTCSHCLRLRRFFHFTKRQASARTPSSVRRCLDCPPDTGGAVGQSVIWISDSRMTQCPHCLLMVLYEVEDEDGFLIVPPHVGAPACSRHPHRVRLADQQCAVIPRACPYRCETCHQHCRAPDCFGIVRWDGRTCSENGDKNHHTVWDVPEEPPSGSEIVVCQLRAMLDRVRPPPLRSDLRLLRQGSQNYSIGVLVDELLTSDLGRRLQRLLGDDSGSCDTGETRIEPLEARQAAEGMVPQRVIVDTSTATGPSSVCNLDHHENLTSGLEEGESREK